MYPLVVETLAAVPLLFAGSVVGGVGATLVMDLAMRRLPEGQTPPRVASGVLTDRPPDSAPRRLAAVVHYVAGALTGPLFAWLALAVAVAVEPVLLAVGIATAVCYLLMVGFFSVVVLPRARLPGQRKRTTARAWGIEAAVYLAVLAPLVAAAGTVL
jgi:hypothetical protein